MPDGIGTARAAGTIIVPSFELPLSAALSPQAAEGQARMLASGMNLNMVDLDSIESEAAYQGAIDAFRAGLNAMFAQPLAERLAAAFAVEIRQDTIGGVPVEVFTPAAGCDEDIVLINLHGGAFYSGAIHIARVESIPLSHFGGMRVISVDYRQGYEYRYPAASEDVAAVYAALLKDYPAGRIGIYGGSAGGTLTLQATAWIMAQGLPAPGVIGVLGAGAGGAGDGTYFSAIGTGKPPTDVFSSIRGSRYGYLSAAPKDDPVVNLLLGDAAFRARFPPCLLVTGTRAFDLSPAIATHRALCQAGVEASLNVFDGMGHCFYYDATLPEAEDVYRTMVRFFRRHLGC